MCRLQMPLEDNTSGDAHTLHYTPYLPTVRRLIFNNFIFVGRKAMELIIKKTITAFILVLAILMTFTGCESMESQAKSLVEKNLKGLQTDGIQAKDAEQLLNVFDSANFSDSDKAKMLEAYNTMIKKMTYTIKSCKVDPSDKDVYIVNVELKTVDGNAIFLNKTVLDEAVANILEEFKSGNFNKDSDAMLVELYGSWINSIIEESAKAEAVKTTTVDLTVDVDRDQNTLYTHVTYLELMGFSGDFDQLLEEMFKDVVSSAFGLDPSDDVNLETFAEVLNNLYKNIDNEYISFSCAANGDTLIFTCTLKIDDVTKEDAEELLDSDELDFDNIIDQVKDADVSCGKVIIKINNINNELLASREENLG